MRESRRESDEVEVIVNPISINEDFDCNLFDNPLTVTRERYILPPCMDLDQLLYLNLNESRLVKVHPYGFRQSGLIKEVDLSELPNDLEIKVGMTVGLAVPSEGNTLGKVLEVNGKTAKVDFNHPRAGELVYCTVTRIG